ncbi:hemerythrin domain-containing protein [Flexivirga caeni]|uniref:Hemerythrin domain-containing protein n=1 Tax=Flexivirga caeni TaxID=2294115 RepID=A0A3M9MBG9_9MICO|nr:hemerythrin domain-containing protein [Flexivirga caeni]RNI22909.1 hemerythrin domain-containing protein [Flexivirga caeni]
MAQEQTNSSHIPTATEIGTAITAQHGMIRMAFQEAKGSAGQRQRHTTRRLLQLLAMHEAAEQLTVHPALARAGGGEVGIGDDRMAEEEQAVQLAERLQEFEPGSYEHGMQLALLEEAVTQHAEAEEMSELPLIDDLDESERRKIGEAVGAVARAVQEDRLVEYQDFSGMVRRARGWLEGRTGGIAR